MALPGKKIIAIGKPDKNAGSDSLYTAFHKINDNFDQVFNSASNLNSFVPGNPGININTDTSNGIVTFYNTGVTELVAGSGILLNNNTGQVTITSINSGNGNGSINSIGINSNSLTITNSPLISSGNIQIELPSNITLPTINSNTVNVNNNVNIGNTSIYWSSIITNSNLPAILIDISSNNITGIECFIKSIDSNSNKRSIFKTLIITDGINSNFVNYGTTHLSNGTGNIDVDINNGNIQVRCWPNDSNTMTWTTQYTVI